MTDPTFEYCSEDDIQADIEGSPRPTAYALQDGFPFSMLSDRQFECLLHDIMSVRTGTNDKRFGDFDVALLMQGVGERGRDCALVKKGKHVGAVQCKRYETLLSKPDAAREIIKFCLHALRDSELMPNPAGFKYVFAVSKDFNERAKKLVSSFKETILAEDKLQEWVTEVIDENKSLSDLKPDEVMPDLLQILEKIDVIPLGFNELNTLLVGHVKVIERYFTVHKVVDGASVDALGEKIDNVLRSLGSEDVRRLLDSLNATPQDRRIDLGLFSLWGYPEGFVRTILNAGKFQPFGMALVTAKGILDNQLVEYLGNRVSNEILAQITARQQFSPITISAAAPYLVGRVLDRWRRNQQGTTLSTTLPKPSILTDSVSVRANVLKLGEAYLSSDWSEYVGDSELLVLKKQIAMHTYGEFQTTEEMAQRFDKEWSDMSPILERIEATIEGEVPQSTTIVVRDLRWFDDTPHVRQVFEKVRQFESGEKPSTSKD